MKVARVLLPSFLLAAIVILVSGRHALLPRAQTIDETGTPCCQADQTAPREVDFPYYSLRDGFNSNLLLVGASPKPTDFVVAVRGLSGRTVLLPAMTIESGEKRSLDLRAALTVIGADVNGDFAEGSVAVYFNGTVMPLPGQLTVSNPSRSLSLESEMVDNSPGLGLLPATLNALWWGLGGGRDARIMVSNTSGDSVTADVFLDFQGDRHESAPLSFLPHETKVLSVSQLLGELKVSPAQAPEGGITIINRGLRPALIAQGKVTDPATGFSTSLNFMDPALQKANALHASGVPIGLPSADSPYAGTGVFIPHVIVRNLTSAPQSVVITLEYPGGKEPQQAPLPPLALGPYATVDVALDTAFGMLPLPLPYCSIRIQYSGAPGSAIAEVSSIESNGDMVIDSRLANERDGWAGSGGHPWHLDEQTESIMFLTNMGEKPARIGFDVVAGGTHYYLTNLKLQPHETQAIDLRNLRDAQKPDFKKNKIPAEATDGSVIWSRLDNVPVMGRLVVLQRHKGVSSNYDCYICDCPADFVDLMIDPASMDLLVNDWLMSDPYAKHQEHCNSYYWWDDAGADYSSDNPIIATATSGGLVTGRAGGSTTIRASYTDYYYTYSSQLQDCVAHPRTRPASGGVHVVTVSIVGGNNFAFVGSDSTVKQYNLEQAQGTPSGGTYAWSKSNSRVSFDNASVALVTLTGNSPSTGLLDTTLTVNYTYNQKPATPATRAITVRIFKFLQQSGSTQVILMNGPSQYGYIANAYYNIFTNPGGQQVSSGFGGMTALELVTINSVSPPGTTVTLHQGTGATNANSQVVDDLSLISNAPLPADLHINASQDISVGGMFVRNNTLDYYPSGPSITNNGPFQ